MSTRDRFEAWITKPPFEKSIERQGENGSWPGNYRDYGVQLAWCAWEDSAKAELERICASIKEEDDHCAVHARLRRLYFSCSRDMGSP